MDEFQYLGKANSAFPSILMNVWDQRLKNTNVMLILSGSLISMMTAQMLSYDSPALWQANSPDAFKADSV